MIYLDANILVFACLAGGGEGDRAREAAKAALRKGAGTCALTVDEVVWALRKEGRGQAIEQGRRILSMPGLRIFDVTAPDAARALDLMAAHGLDPRDALHAAVALSNSCKTILTEDTVFERVPGLRRKGLA